MKPGVWHARMPARLAGPEPLSTRRRVAAFLGWSAITGLGLMVAMIVHLATPLGRAAAADGFEAFLSSRIRGTAHVGGVTRLDFDGIELSQFSVTSPSGERVISADRMTTEFAVLESLRRRALVLTPCELEGGEMRLTRGPGDQIDLVHAMEVPDDRVMIPILIRDIRLLHQTMVLDLPGAPGPIEMRNVYGLVDMTLGHQFVARMDQVHGVVDIPVVDVGFERLTGRVQSDDATPLVVRMVLDLDVAEPSMEIRYAAPSVVGRDGGGGIGINLGADVPDEREIGRPRERASAD